MNIAIAIVAAAFAALVAATPLYAATAAQTTTAMSDGWAALASGDLAGAARAAQRAMSESPRSVAAGALAVEVDIARGGNIAGLDIYERWLAGRKVEAPYLLRRIAQARLRTVSASRTRQPAETESLAALAADGEQDAAAELARRATAGNLADATVLASMGDPRGVDVLIRQLATPAGGKLGAINALAESGSKRAIAALVPFLSDAREEYRSAAADALGRLGAAQAIAQIKPLLNDPVVPVRLGAAGALYRLQDYSGVNMLDGMLTSEHATVRLSAAQMMAGTPTPTWQSVVRTLANEPDETVQLGAARLIAPYDLQLAASVLERLGQSENPTVREEAGRAFVRGVAGDFSALRRYLRNGDTLTSVRAATRILELTR